MAEVIYIEWWDAVSQDGQSQAPNPEVVLFKGYTNLLSENKKEVIVAQFLGDEEGAYFDRLAIPRPSIKLLCRFIPLSPA